ncbi:unnamed protein product [Cochlearia groenlandica]
MEKFERRNKEETYIWLPFHFVHQTLQALLKCLGLLHRDSPTTTKTASSPTALNQPEEEEEEDAATRNDVVMTSRGTVVRSKKKDKERVSTGHSGKEWRTQD